MKQHVTVDDLNKLTTDQTDKLRFLWIPKKYDLVSTRICVDAENDTYENIEFVVGNVEVFENTVELQDICSMNFADEPAPDTDTDIDEEESDSDEDDAILDSELAYDLENARPSIYNLGECLPLLSIGNMLEILINSRYDLNNIEVDITEDEYIFNSIAKKYNDYDEDIKSEELCDVLWHEVCEIL